MLKMSDELEGLHECTVGEEQLVVGAQGEHTEEESREQVGLMPGRDIRAVGARMLHEVKRRAGHTIQKVQPCASVTPDLPLRNCGILFWSWRAGLAAIRAA